MVDITWEFYYDFLNTWTAHSGTSDIMFPINIRYGFNSNKPQSAHVAGSGQMTLFLDNVSSDLPYSDTSVGGEYTEYGLGARYLLRANYGPTSDDYIDLFQGRVFEWNTLPGLFDERVTEVVTADYIYELNNALCDGVSVTANANAATLLPSVTSDLPAGSYWPPSISNFSTNGEVFTLAFHDVFDGETKAMTAISKITGSEIAHFYCEPRESLPIIYRTHQDWIDMGRTDIGTLSDRFTALEVGKSREFEFSPIFVTYYPARTGDSNEILFSYAVDLVVDPGETKTIRNNYRDPNTMDVQVAVFDTDLVAPVDATDYIYTQASSDDASSDLSVTYTNKGSAGEYAITNNGIGIATFTTLQARGKPIYIYDKAVLSYTNVTEPSAISAHVNLKYQDDPEFADNVLNFYRRIYGRYPVENMAKSITFMATADSDTWNMAVNGKIGSSFTLVETTNKINANYRITGIEWDIIAQNLVFLTWEIYPTEYTTLHMVDSDREGHFTDSNGARFSFWR